MKYSIRWSRTKSGASLGEIRGGEWRAPPPMAPLDLSCVHRPEELSTLPLAAAVERLLTAYDANLRSRKNRGAPSTPKQFAAYSKAAQMLLDARVSIESYVTFAMRRMARVRGRTPYRAEVISPAAVTSWLAAYQRANGEVLQVAMYQATSARQVAWLEWKAKANAIND